MTDRSQDQDLIDDLVAWMQAPDTKSVQTNGHATPKSASGSSEVPDEIIIEKCCSAGNSAKFEALFDRGDVHAYHGGDDSVADLALAAILAYYTQDAEQLGRLISSSALGRREKWRGRDDYRKRTIQKALSGLGETYDWESQRSRPLGNREVSLVSPPYIGNDTSDTSDGTPQKLSLVRFANREIPAPREFIVPDLIPRYHPTTLYGWGGTAKSLMALLLGMGVAGGMLTFFGRAIAVRGPTLYIDFELDADEQHRRVAQLAAGMKMKVPEDLLYLSTLGVHTHGAVEYALSVCEEHDVVMVVLDSLGPAMVGDMAAARDVIGFHNQYIAPFKAVGATPLLVDHQARQQSGEGYQSKGAFGSAYKEHLSRSLIQVERGDQSADQGTLNIRLRHKKANFGALVEPFDVSLSFSDEMIVATKRDLTPSDRAQEATLNGEERVVAALEDGPAYTDEIVESTGLALGTVKNKLTALKKAGRVEATGETRSQMEQVQLVSPVSRPIKGSDTSDTSDKESPTLHDGTDEPTTVADLFANPPGWLPTQLKLYRENPEKHIQPLCTAVAAVVLGDGLRWEEIREEVEKVLEETEG